MSSPDGQSHETPDAANNADLHIDASQSTATQETQESPKDETPKKPWYQRVRWWGWCLIAIAAVIIAIGGTFGVQALMVRSHINQVVNIAKETVSSGNLKELPQQVKRMQKETQAANNITHSGLWNAAVGMPGLGVNVRTLQGMTDVVNNTMDQTVPKYAEIASTIDIKTLFKNGQINVEPVVKQVPELIEANDSLKEQAEDYNNLPQPNFGPVSSIYNMGKNLLSSGVQYADLAVDTLPQVPEWLGYNGKQTWAILAMTPSEMRASGGLVGAIGTVTLDKGKIEVGDFMSNVEFAKYGAGNLTHDEYRVYVDQGPLHMSYDVRDITNYADTQRTAESFQAIWNRSPYGENTPLSGVVVADPVFVQTLVKVLGDVKLPDGRVLNGNNTAEFLMNTVYKDYKPEDTDQYFGIVAKTCVNRLMGDLDMSKLGTLSMDMHTLARNRHLNAYSFNPDIEYWLFRYGFTAAAPLSETHPTIGVYLTEQNPSKMGWYIKRSTTIEPTNCGEDGPQKYRVTYSLTNTLSKEEASKLDPYVTGMVPEVRGTGFEKIVFYPPKGGTISNFQVSGNGTVPVADALNWHLVYYTTTQIQPESTVTYSFDVATSSLAEHELKVDQTPTGQETADVKYIKQCPVY